MSTNAGTLHEELHVSKMPYMKSMYVNMFNFDLEFDCKSFQFANSNSNDFEFERIKFMTKKPLFTCSMTWYYM